MKAETVPIIFTNILKQGKQKRCRISSPLLYFRESRSGAKYLHHYFITGKAETVPSIFTTIILQGKQKRCRISSPLLYFRESRNVAKSLHHYYITGKAETVPSIFTTPPVAADSQPTSHSSGTFSLEGSSSFSIVGGFSQPPSGFSQPSGFGSNDFGSSGFGGVGLNSGGAGLGTGGAGLNSSGFAGAGGFSSNFPQQQVAAYQAESNFSGSGTAPDSASSTPAMKVHSYRIYIHIEIICPKCLHDFLPSLSLVCAAKHTSKQKVVQNTTRFIFSLNTTSTYIFLVFFLTFGLITGRWGNHKRRVKQLSLSKLSKALVSIISLTEIL